MTDARLRIRPITHRAANAFVHQLHRHSRPTVGAVIAVAVADTADHIRGVAIAARALPIALTARQIRDGFAIARAAVGMSHIRFHDLRHTYASWLVQGGAGLAAVRDLLGHSSLAVTSRYSHLARPDLVAATSKLKI